MKIAVLSGKGGTGKTFVSVNLAVAAKSAVYIDCDVEEPNGRIFLKPLETIRQEVSVYFPEFIEDKCIGCRKCTEFCRFNALIYIRNKPKVFREVCHSCGGCELVCSSHAVHEIPYAIGNIEIGQHKEVTVVTGILNIGEASGIAIIKDALALGNAIPKDTIIIDCPPGSACSVTESIADADYCLMVVEPTAFGFHNFQMIYELVKLMNKRCGVVINKEHTSYSPLEDFCNINQIPILLRIPYDQTVAEMTANGLLAVEEKSEVRNMFEKLLLRIGGDLQ